MSNVESEIGSPSTDVDVQPTPPSAVIGAGSSHNSGIAAEWQPGLAQTVTAAASAEGQMGHIMSVYQAQAAQFIAEHGADVLAGHSPVGMAAADVAGPSDFGSPGSAGSSDNSGSTST